MAAPTNSAKSDQEDFFENLVKISESDDSGCKKCFETFDQDRDGFLNEDEFFNLVDELFIGHKEQTQRLDNKCWRQVFQWICEDETGNISFDDFQKCWKYWIQPLVLPRSALLVVDVQNDFITGSLALKECPAKQDGAKVVPVINHLLRTVDFDVVVYTQDWHPPNHCSFIDNIKHQNLHPSFKRALDTVAVFDSIQLCRPSGYDDSGDGLESMKESVEQIMWPRHCVQGTHGAELHPDLMAVDNAVIIRKGGRPDVDSYSAFWDNQKLACTPLLDELMKRNITDVYHCGLAYDVCVAATARHSLEHGFRTIVIDDACRGVSDENIWSTKTELKRSGAIAVSSLDVSDMVYGKTRNADLGYFSATQYRTARQLAKQAVPLHN